MLNYVEIMVKKSSVENCVEKLVGRVGWENKVKGEGEKCF